jgi:hypothetical protein
MKRRAGVILFMLPFFLARFADAQEKIDEEVGYQAQKTEGLEGPPRNADEGDRADVDNVAQAAQRKRLGDRIEKALQKFAFEPSLAELQKAALSYQDTDPETAKRWRKAPNRAALLPTLKFVFDRDLERDESLDRYQDEPDRWGADTDHDLGFQVSAQWELDELVFNSDEVRVWGALADRASRREALLTMLVGYYFERRKLQLKELLSPPEDIEEMAELKLRIAELTASIDALTGGCLSAELQKKAKKKTVGKKTK